jgi:ABC-type Mn2+/Zn2+ transport system permease subunit
MNPFAADFLFRDAVIGGLLVALLCGVLGIYVVLRRLAMLGVALPQAGAAGVAFAFWAGRHQHVSGADAHGLALAGSIGFTFAALCLIVLGGRRSRFPADSRIAAAFALSSALTFLFVALDPGGDFEVTSLLRGELLAISAGDLALLGWIAGIAGALFVVFRREILLASFDPDFARSLGGEPTRTDVLLYALLGLAIAVGVTTAGPLVVFGFLTLPALAALRLAGSLRAAFALAAGVATASSLGGFLLAYHADLPAGPVEVAVAAGFWLAASGVGALGRGRRVRVAAARALAAGVVLLAGLASTGCGTFSAADETPQSAARGTLPEPDPARPVAVMRMRNETGDRLRLPASNPVHEIGRAAGDPFADGGVTVPDALEEIAIQELERRGFAVLAAHDLRSRAPVPPPDRVNAIAVARREALPGPVLLGTLRRWTVTRSQILLVWLDLELVDPLDGSVLWSGSARRPVSVPAALTLQEIVRDAGPAIFADAFGAP